MLVKQSRLGCLVSQDLRLTDCLCPARARKILCFAWRPFHTLLVGLAPPFCKLLKLRVVCSGTAPTWDLPPSQL